MIPYRGRTPCLIYLINPYFHRFYGYWENQSRARFGRVLKRTFVDTDELVVDAAGKTIPEIFEQEGETAFRQLEHQAVIEASKMGNVIVSLGGGAITQERNWTVIRKTGVCLCFRASVDTIMNGSAASAIKGPCWPGWMTRV